MSRKKRLGTTHDEGHPPYQFHGYRTSLSGYNASELEEMIQVTQAALNRSKNVRDTLLNYAKQMY
jgi:hypothetical protein